MPTKPSAKSRRRRSRPLVTPGMVVGVIAVLAIGIGIAVMVSGSGSDDGTESVNASAQSGKPVLAELGEKNSMGMPVVETPGSATGEAAAAGIVVNHANWELGKVPLNVAVRPAWILRNTGSTPVTILEPKPNVKEGCCPGPFTISSSKLAPGEEATLTFELSMHAGMDGWHDIDVVVPIQPESGAQEILTLNVTGDFRD